MTVTRREFINSGLILSSVALITNAFWVEKHFIETNEFYFGSASPTTDNIIIVQVSDLHIKSINSTIRKLAKKINELKPDLIAITGDAIDEANNLTLFNEFLILINVNIPKVAILGNWEYWSEVDLGKLKNVYQKHNCTLLVNESKQFQVGK
jgi:predicted MPP superfamily phosphohydrolase